MIQLVQELSKRYRVLPLFLLLSLITNVCQSQSYDVIIKNRRIISDTSMDFDVYVRNNDNSGSWGMRSFQCGYQFDSIFVNGGVLSCRYITGSSEMDATFGKTWGFSWNAKNFVLNHSANTGSNCPGGIITAAEKRIGSFRVTNSNKWGCAKDNISIMRSGTGFLKLAVTKYNDIFCTILNALDITSQASTVILPTIQNFEAAGCSSFNWNGISFTQSGIYYYSPTKCDIHNDTLNLNIDSAFRWLGNVSSAWENPLNWSCSSLPDSNSIVIIPSVAAFMPEINSAEAVCKKIYFEKASTIRIRNKGRLNVRNR